MSGQGTRKGSGDRGKDVKEARDPKDTKKPGATSVHTTPANPKRPFSEIANSSAEEIVLLNNQMDEISTDIKNLTKNMNILMSKSESMMNRDDMRTFIRSTVEGIMREINNNMEVTIEAKVNEKRKHLRDRNKQLTDDIKSLQGENIDLKARLSEAKKRTWKL